MNRMTALSKAASPASQLDCGVRLISGIYLVRLQGGVPMDDKYLPPLKEAFVLTEAWISAFMLFIMTPLAFWLVPKIMYMLGFVAQ